MEITFKILDFLQEMSKKGAITEEALSLCLDTIPKNQISKYLNQIGYYNITTDFSISFIEKIYQKIGKLHSSSILFGVMIFNYDIQNQNLKSIGTKLEHPFFDDVQKELKIEILEMLSTSKNLPTHMSPSVLKPLLIGNYPNLPVLSKGKFINISKELVKKEKKEKIPSEGQKLAEKIKIRVDSLKDEYTNPLYVLNLEKKEIELIQSITISYLTSATRDPNLIDFIKVWTEGGLLFISLVVCAKDLDKNDNKTFWKEYYRWLNLNNREIKTRGRNHITKAVLRFWDKDQTNYLKTNVGDNKFVMTFLMHSIISNRPLSKELVVKFLKKIVKSTGTIYHDESEQRELLEQNLYSYSIPITETNDENISAQQYLQIPRETAYAFNTSKEQTINFLEPIYDYIEKILIDKVNDNYQDSVDDNGVPLFLREVIEETIVNTSKEELLRVRKITTTHKLDKPTIFLDIKESKVFYKIPSYIFLDLNTKLDISIEVKEESGNIIYNAILPVKNDEDYTITEELSIECENPLVGIKYRIIYNQQVLTENKIQPSLFYDYYGFPLNFPISQPQHIFVLAKADRIIADNFSCYEIDFINGLSLYQIYLDENSLAVVNDRIYGLSDDSTPSSIGWTKKNDIYCGVRVKVDEKFYPVISDYPIFFMRRHTNPKSSVLVAVNGHEVPYTILTENLIPDGTGETFYRIKIEDTSIIKNGELVVIRIYDPQENKDLIQLNAVVIQDLSFSFSERLYFDKKDVSTHHLTFKDSNSIFRGFYKFPSDLYKFKINISNLDNSRLILPAPLITLKLDSKELLKDKIWYEEIVLKKKISIDHPVNIISTKIYSKNDKDKIIHHLTKKGHHFATHRLRDRLSPKNKKVDLILFVQENSGDTYEYKICELFYHIDRIKDNPFLYIPPSEHINLKIEPGLKITFNFLGDKHTNYLVQFSNSDNHIFFEENLSEDLTLVQHLKRELPTGNYTIKVFQKQYNRFLGTEDTKEVYSENIAYPFKESKIIKASPMPTMPDAPETVKTEVIILDKHPNKKQTIKFTHLAQRTIHLNDGIFYMKDLKIHPFYIFTAATLKKGEPFKANIFYYLESKRREVDSLNSSSIEILEYIGDSEVIVSIVNTNNESLIIGEKTKQIDPEQHQSSEKKLHKKYFYGKLLG